MRYVVIMFIVPPLLSLNHPFISHIGANFVGSSIRDLDTLISKMAETGDGLYHFFSLFSLIYFLNRVDFQ